MYRRARRIRQGGADGRPHPRCREGDQCPSAWKATRPSTNRRPTRMSICSPAIDHCATQSPPMAGRPMPALAAFGRRWGSGEMFALGRQANEQPPNLVTFDAKGFRRDAVEFHPAYHLFMAETI